MGGVDVRLTAVFWCGTTIEEEEEEEEEKKKKKKKKSLVTRPPNAWYHHMPIFHPRTPSHRCTGTIYESPAPAEAVSFTELALGDATAASSLMAVPTLICYVLATRTALMWLTYFLARSQVQIVVSLSLLALERHSVVTKPSASPAQRAISRTPASGKYRPAVQRPDARIVWEGSKQNKRESSESLDGTLSARGFWVGGDQEEGRKEEGAVLPATPTREATLSHADQDGRISRFGGCEAGIWKLPQLQ
ncbi:hypothetical protein MMC11_005858 [Xylographa trunciseda]|nr:hypothetical protein [Xylographa trunciseda]